MDPLSMTFVMLVTFVGSLIHIYSVAYMEHDKDRRRFFAYLNFFIASMLIWCSATPTPSSSWVGKASAWHPTC